MGLAQFGSTGAAPYVGARFIAPAGGAGLGGCGGPKSLRKTQAGARVGSKKPAAATLNCDPKPETDQIVLRRLSTEILSPRRPWLPVLLFVAVSLLTAHGLLESLDSRLQIALTLTPSPLLRGVWRVIGTAGSSVPSLLLMLLAFCLLQRR